MNQAGLVCIAASYGAFISGIRYVSRCCARISILIVFVFGLSSVQAREIQDLALGVALYEYFQNKDFEALSEILIAEESQRLHHQADFASQFAAGIMLSYGMDNAAVTRMRSLLGTDFASWLPEGHLSEEKLAGQLELDTKTTSDASSVDQASYSKVNRARSKYYLAKLLYRKGEHENAYEVLKSIDKSLTKELKPEMAFLLNNSFLHQIQTQVALKAQRSDNQSAELKVVNNKQANKVGSQNDLLSLSSNLESNTRLPSKKRLRIWGDYLKYNRSIVAMGAQSLDSDFDSVEENKTGFGANQSSQLKQLQRLAESISETLQKVKRSDQSSRFDELLNLRDRALLSIAYLYLLDQQPDDAVRHLRAYSAEGIEVEEALLAYGWAELQRERYEQAIASWSQLADGDIAQASTRESLLGIAHIYELQQDTASAIQGYDTAIVRFQSELDLLAELDNEDSKSTYLDMVQALQLDSLNWLDDYTPANAQLDAQSAKLLQRLKHFVGSNQFLVLLNQRRDLQWLEGLAQQWEQTADAMRASIDNQRSRFSEVFERGRKAQLEDQYLLMQQRLKKLKVLQARAIQRDFLLLMDEREQANYARAQHVLESSSELQAKLSQLAAEHDAANVQVKAHNTNTKVAQYSAMSRLMAGQIIWDVSQQADAKISDISRGIKASEAALQQASEQLQAITQLVPLQASQQLASSRLAMLEARQKNIQLTVAKMSASLDHHLYTAMADEINTQRQLVSDYLAQAKLAKARLLDEQFMQSEAAQLAINSGPDRHVAEQSAHTLRKVQ